MLDTYLAQKRSYFTKSFLPFFINLARLQIIFLENTFEINQPEVNQTTHERNNTQCSEKYSSNEGQHTLYLKDLQNNRRFVNGESVQRIVEKNQEEPKFINHVLFDHSIHLTDTFKLLFEDQAAGDCEQKSCHFED